jgi:hypothetical protein
MRLIVLQTLSSLSGVEIQVWYLSFGGAKQINMRTPRRSQLVILSA